MAIKNRIKHVVRTPLFRQRVVEDKRHKAAEQLGLLTRLECPDCHTTTVDYINPAEIAHLVCEDCGTGGLLSSAVD